MARNKDVSKITERVECIEKIQADGIDWLANEIKVLFQNDSVIGSAVEEHDTTIGAIRALLVSKGILTDEEIDKKRTELDKIRADAMEHQQAVAKQKAELNALSDAADAAGKEGHPPEAFIFGS